jgi:hypothetical protein
MLATPRPLESLPGQEWHAGQLESLHLPASLCAGLRLTPEQFTVLCEANPDAVLKLLDSSTGFRLPDDSVFSPDAALVALDRWQALSAEERRGFAPLCPDLVVELASPRDEGPRGLTASRQKMAAYRRNGALLGWLLIPAERAVEIWESPTASAASGAAG